LSVVRHDAPADLRGTDRNSEGHTESTKTQSVREKELRSVIKVTPEQMQCAFPKLCADLRFAPTQEACERLMGNIANYLHLGDLWSDIKDRGPTLSFMILGYLLERSDQISTPRAYATVLIKKWDAGLLDWQTLLTRPKPKSA